MSRPTMPEYHELDHEDPEKFLRKVEGYFNATATIRGDFLKANTAEPGLKGEAEKMVELQPHIISN